ncbi:MAG TPA: hypothetical protein VI455_20835 [Terriglobia bacterium]
MKRIKLIDRMFLLLTVLMAGTAILTAQGGFEVVTGKAFDSAFVKDFYLEGNSIPTEKRNAALVKTPGGARVEFALLDTTGYSSQVQQKYSGMIISEGTFSAGGVKLGVGSFGFGTKMPRPPSGAEGQVFFYDQAGNSLGDCPAKKDSSLKSPRPLQVITTGGSTRLYLGVYWIELQ